MIDLTALEQQQIETVARSVILRDQVPATMLDCHARLDANRFEAHVEFRRLVGRKCCLPPRERKPFAGLPDGNPADLELLSVPQRRDQPSAFARLETQISIPVRRQLKEWMRAPPFADFLSERFKRTRWRGADAERNDDRGGHLRFFST